MDSVVAGILAAITAGVLIGVGAAIGGAVGTLVTLVGVVAAVAVPTYYFVRYESRSGATPGKKLMDIEVVDEHGNPPSAKQALIRRLLLLVDQMPSFYIIGIALIYSNDDNQRLGDMVADTYVVSSSP